MTINGAKAAKSEREVSCCHDSGIQQRYGLVKMGWNHQDQFQQMETVGDERLKWLMKLRKNHTLGADCVRHRQA